jgi:predicted nuclease of predicted toxin-antitoxin system
MKIKLDENLPPILAAPLRSLGHDVHTVVDEALAGASDEVLWLMTQGEQRFLLTQDMAFSDARKYAAGSHFGILILRLDNRDFTVLIKRVMTIFQEEDVESWSGCCVVAAEQKIRVTRPSSSPAGT